jgi:hypothetical protein
MLERAKAAIENGIATKLHLGAQLYVSCGGETVGDFAFGEAREGVPMRPETLMFWISSVKPIHNSCDRADVGARQART